MSRHFELMEQMERERSSSVEPGVVVPGYRPQTRNATATGTLGPRWASEEAFRLVQQIFFLQTQVAPRIVVFAGVDHGSGCTQICAAVAETLAKNSRKPVCLVEGNFRSPGLTSLYGTSNQQGLSNSLLSSGPISSFTTPTRLDNLMLLSSGTVTSDSPALLTGGLLGERLQELRAECDYVIIDAPPLSRYSDAVLLGQQADGVVLILEADLTRRESATKATNDLRASNVPVLAAVLNKRTYPVPKAIYNRL
jgi:capsular exopolysaccharide synthesis family protein